MNAPEVRVHSLFILFATGRVKHIPCHVIMVTLNTYRFLFVNINMYSDDRLYISKPGGRILMVNAMVAILIYGLVPSNIVMIMP